MDLLIWFLLIKKLVILASICFLLYLRQHTYTMLSLALLIITASTNLIAFDWHNWFTRILPMIIFVGIVVLTRPSLHPLRRVLGVQTSRFLFMLFLALNLLLLITLTLFLASVKR